jgi:hypothetical protein
MYKMVVVVERARNQIVGSGTLVIELKISKSNVAKIEDVNIEAG